METPAAETSALDAELRRLGPHLQMLGLGYNIPVQDGAWAAFTRLSTLLFSSIEAFDRFASRIAPSSLRRIILRPQPQPPSDHPALLRVLKASSSSLLAPVQVMHIPSVSDKLPGAAKLEANRAHDQCVALCAEHGMEVRETPTIHKPHWSEYMDELLSLWLVLQMTPLSSATILILLSLQNESG